MPRAEGGRETETIIYSIRKVPVVWACKPPGGFEFVARGPLEARAEAHLRLPDDVLCRLPARPAACVRVGGG